MFKTIKKNLTISAVAVTVGLTSLATDVFAAEHNWRFSNLYSRGTAFGEVYENLAENIEKLSEGKIKVQVLYSGEGVGTSGLLSAVKSGLITMGAPFQSMHAGELPAGVVEIGLPGGTDDPAKL
jgi:TRAP-type mannitol/chloroaromatic compound transport system substrate-binding protein